MTGHHGVTHLILMVGVEEAGGGFTQDIQFTPDTMTTMDKAQHGFLLDQFRCMATILILLIIIIMIQNSGATLPIFHYLLQ